MLVGHRSYKSREQCRFEAVRRSLGDPKQVDLLQKYTVIFLESDTFNQSEVHSY